MGYQLPNSPVMVNGNLERIPVISGKLWTDLVKFADVAMNRVKAECKKVPAGRVFKVYKTADNKSVVERIGGEGMEVAP